MSKPSSRKAAKRSGRAKAVRAKVTARRQKLRELREAVGKLDPSRNLHVEKGRVVTVNDITPHARQKCKDCKGKGITGTNKDDDGTAVSATPCRCATARFFKAHGEIIVDSTGAAWWPADAEQPATAATGANDAPTEPTE